MFFGHNLVNIGVMIVGATTAIDTHRRSIFARLELKYINFEGTYWQLIMHAEGDIACKFIQN